MGSSPSEVAIVAWELTSMRCLFPLAGLINHRDDYKSNVNDYLNRGHSVANCGVCLVDVRCSPAIWAMLVLQATVEHDSFFALPYTTDRLKSHATPSTHISSCALCDERHDVICLPSHRYRSTSARRAEQLLSPPPGANARTHDAPSLCTYATLSRLPPRGGPQ